MKTITFERGIVRLIDQRLLPRRLSFLECRSWKDVERAIREMAIRGAPALGVAGAFAIALEAYRAKTKEELLSTTSAAAHIAEARPTARNLSWAVERMMRSIEGHETESFTSLKRRTLAEARRIAQEDVKKNRRLSRHGAGLIKKGSRVLTICNAGGLACVEVGTALGVIEEAWKQGKVEMVYASETRPLLQGARLTCYELKMKGIPTTLIVDSAAAFLMQKKMISCIIVGADRIARNGDTANKIGTYALACLARLHTIPFYVAAPSSTFDLSLASGKEIAIEERACSEVLGCAGRRTAPDVPCWNPAFDVTPTRYVSAFVTERGVMAPREITKRI